VVDAAVPLPSGKIWPVILAESLESLIEIFILGDPGTHAAQVKEQLRDKVLLVVEKFSGRVTGTSKISLISRLMQASEAFWIEPTLRKKSLELAKRIETQKIDPDCNVVLKSN
jgi:hypothetical protein